jgi:hypothetical protein
MEYSHLVIEMDESDGRCYFGIQAIASISGLVVDLICGIGLTSLFFYLLRPTIKVHSTAPVSNVIRLSMSMEASGTAVQRSIRILLRKSILGAVLFNILFMANMTQLVITGGREPGTICLLICVLDSTSLVPSVENLSES